MTLVGGRQNSDSFRVSYVSDRPDTARKVTERLASLYIEQNLKDRENQAESTSQFLETQLQEAKQRLLEQEKKLEEYRNRHSGRTAHAAAGKPAEHPERQPAAAGAQRIDEPGARAAAADRAANRRERIGGSVSRISGEDPIANAIAFARYADGSFGWNINDPGHGFVLARDDAPLYAAAAAPLSASGTWGPLLLTDDADYAAAPTS